MNKKNNIVFENDLNEPNIINLDIMKCKTIEGTELDQRLIDENDVEMKKLEKELHDLLDSIHLINEMVNKDSEKIEKIDENIIQADIKTSEAVNIVETTVPKIKAIREKFLEIKMAAGGVSAGLLFGGIGFLIGGPVGTAIGTPLGAGLGTLGGWLTKFIK